MALHDEATPGTELPEDKHLEDHTAGLTMAERTERAEAGEPDPGEEPAEHAGGKA